MSRERTSGRRWRPALAILAASSVAVAMTATVSGAQDITPAEVERLRRAAGSSFDLGGEMTGSDVQQLLNRMNRTALDSLQQAAEAARQIPGIEPVPAPATPPPSQPPAARVTGPQPLPMFGYDIFESSLEGYQPLEIGPVGPDYVVGPGDELVITLWGATELVQTIQVDREGRAFFRDVGLIPVAGRTIEQLRQEVRIRLEKVYSGLREGPDGASTFVDLSLGALRTVQVFAIGEVGRPGAYRVPSNGTVLDLLYRAGGAGSGGSLRSIRIVRAGRQVASFDLYLTLLEGDLSGNLRLESGDVVLVPPVGARVTLQGEVFRPAVYEILPGEGLSELLRMAGGLTSTAYLERATLRRIVPPAERRPDLDYGWEIVSLDARQLAGISTTPFTLHDGDQIEIHRISSVTGAFVAIDGNGVMRPAQVELRDGLTVRDLVEAAGGLKPDASIEEAHLIRRVPGANDRLLSLRLDGDPGAADWALPLQDRDVLTIRSLRDFEQAPMVTISGPVKSPGRYRLLENQSLQDLIFAAGGLLEDAYGLTAEVARVDSALSFDPDLARTQEIPIVGWDTGDGPAARFVLQRHDRVFIRRIPGWELDSNVSLSGAIEFPGIYALTHTDERLSDLVNRAGGLRGDAYPEGAVFTRLESETGRVAIDLKGALEDPGSRHDLVMMNGDELYVPRRPHTVKVVGEVGLPTSILYRPGKGVGYYLDQAGGLTENADKKRVLVRRASGEVHQGTGGLLSRGPRIDPGTIIMVPTRAPRREGSTLKDLANVVSILSGAATTIFLIHEVTK